VENIQVVAMIRLKPYWASVSIDVVQCITHLIHPTLSGTPHLNVLQVFQPMMEKLTKYAVTHIKQMANRRIPDIPWVYDVALKKQHTMHGYRKRLYVLYKITCFPVSLLCAVFSLKSTVLCF
jgi:hypothetical protein